MKCRVQVCKDYHLTPETVDAIIHAIDKTGIIVTLNGKLYGQQKVALPLECLMDVEKFINKDGEYYIPGTSCPICGSENVTFDTMTRTMNPYGAGEISIEVVNNICNECSADGDFNGINDVRIENAIQEIVNKRASESIRKLHAENIATVHIEISLGLKIGSINRWKAEGFPMEAYALLRLIEFNPLLIDVAKAGYPPVKICIAGNAIKANMDDFRHEEEILKDFSQKLLDGMEPCPPEYTKVLMDNFEDLLA